MESVVLSWDTDRLILPYVLEEHLTSVCTCARYNAAINVTSLAAGRECEVANEAVDLHDLGSHRRACCRD
jgi:hypothetical protein